jgi:DNA-binding response OmpR family regulator
MGTRTLVVEDDADIRELIIRVLRSDGHDVSGVVSGEEALDVLAQEDDDGFGLAVVDYALPGMTGADLVLQMRSEGNALPVLMVTGRGEELSQRAARASGIDDYLAKPFSPRELSARAAAVLTGSEGASPPAPRGA